MNRLCIVCLAAALYIGGIGAAAATSGYALFNQGIAARSRDDNAAAVTALTAALAAPDLQKNLRPVALLDRGYAHVDLRDQPAALADFSAAIEADPAYVLPYIARANLYAEQSRYPLAIADLSSAVQLRPHLELLLYKRCNANLLAGNLAAALSDCSTVVNTVYDPDCRRLRAQIYIRMGDQRAKDDIDWLWRDGSRVSLLYDLRGDFERSTGKIDDALDDYETASDKAPHDARIMVHVGVAHWLLGESGRARKNFAAALAQTRPPVSAALWKSITDGTITADDFAKLDLGAWPGPLAKVYLGRMAPEAAMAAARDGAAGAVLQDRVCEADFYLGEWSFLQKDADTGTRRLNDALRDCTPDNPERQGAQIALKTLPAASVQ